MKTHHTFSAAGWISGLLALLAAAGLLCSCAGIRGSGRGSVESSMNEASKKARAKRYAPVLMNVTRVRIACDNPTIREEVSRMIRRGKGPEVVDTEDPSVHVLSVTIRCGMDFAYQPVYTPRPSCVGIDPLTEERIRTSAQNGDPTCVGTLTLHRSGKSVWLLTDRDRFQDKKQVIFFVDRMTRSFLKEWHEARS
jgi:hypothetical protein